MSEEFEFNFSELRKKRRRAGGNSRRSHRGAPRAEPLEDGASGGFIENGAADSPGPSERTFSLPIDPWRFLDALRTRWHWIFLSAVVMAWCGFMLGFWKANYKVSFELMRRTTIGVAPTPGNQSDAISGRDISLDALAGLIRSPALLETVCSNAAALNLQLTPHDLQKMVEAMPTRNPDLVQVQMKRTGSVRQAITLANVFATNLIEFTRGLQQADMFQISRAILQKKKQVDDDLAAANEELKTFLARGAHIDVSKEAQAFLGQVEGVEKQIQEAKLQLHMLDAKLAIARKNPASDELSAARQRLNELKLKYTPEHPEYKMAVAMITELEQQAAVAVTNAPPLPRSAQETASNRFGNPWSNLQMDRILLTNQLGQLEIISSNLQKKAGALSEATVDYALLKSKVDALEAMSATLENKRRETDMFKKDAAGYYDLFSPAQAASLDPTGRWLRIALLAILGAFVGSMGATGLVLAGEATDARIKTIGDVTRITGLPVLATLGDLTKMDPTEQVNWAFRTLTILKGKLNAANGHSLVCGVISAEHGEGRSTWINLLVSAASQRGFRVLTVDTRPIAPEAENEPQPVHVNGDAAPNGNGEISQLPAPARRLLLSSQVLARPSEIAAQLDDPDAQPVVHIPLPGWVWNLERRKQWQSALKQWREIENLVLLVELPPASQPESLLLAENLPQLVWLSSSGTSSVAETKAHLETLRHARCNLVGAVLNRAPAGKWRRRFSHWFGTGAAALLLLCGAVQAQVTNSLLGGPAPRETNLLFSASNSIRRYPWQERLTLGPGDVVNIALYKYPELSRTNLFVGPDGRLSYLQAQNIEVAGLTIDELREKLDPLLAKYYPVAQTIVTPVSFNSKKYFMLGKINAQGAYRLDRPLTIVEAVARAHGLETGLLERRTVEMADLSRSFLIRDGQKLPVDFEKLFLDGDLSQNIALQPNDYLYFASANENQIYVLGQILNPGVVVYVPNSSLIAAITSRGGFTQKAYKKKVLVVRGSLRDPETFVVDVDGILEARLPDFKLQQRDIVYVSIRPWSKVEDLLDEAGQAFVEAAVASWAGVNIGPIIKRPFVPSL